MESWRNGREELFEELTKICNRIDQNVVAEIDQENYTSIAQDELRFLNEKSATVDALIEENGRLASELEQHRDTSMRMEALEKENQRLAGELEKAIQRTRNIPTPTSKPRTGNGANLVSGPSTPTSTTNANENDETITEMRNKYYTLVGKYNALHANFTDIKSARLKLEELSRKQQGKIKEWKTHADRLAKEKRKLQQNARMHKDTAEELNIDVDSGGLKSEAVPDEVDILLFPEMQQPLPIQVPISPAEGAQDLQEKTLRSESKLHTGIPLDPELLPGECKEAEEEAMELPIHSDRESLIVNDTQFVELELEHTGSTQDYPLPESPKPIGDEYQVSNKDKVSSASQDPVVISCKSVKKRKSLHGQSQATPISKIKVENISSSPVRITALHYLNSSDSIDLDEIGEKVDTPKKRRRILELSRTASGIHDDSQVTAGDENQGHSNTNGSSLRSTSRNNPVPPHSHNRIESALQPLSVNKQILPRTSYNTKAPQKRRLVSDRAVEELIEDGQSVSISNSSRKPEIVGPATRLGSLLENPSPTKRVLSPNTSNGPGTASLHNHHTWTKACATKILSCEMDSTSGNESDGTKSTRSSIRRLLDLSRPLSRESVPPGRQTSRGTPKPLVDSLQYTSAHKENICGKPSGAPRELPWLSSNNTPISTSKSPVRKSIEQVSTPKGSERRSAGIIKPSATKARSVRTLQNVGLNWDDHPDNKTLRTQPLSMLTISDFKINPNHNQGYDYAFRDVVRGRDQRKCLPGCTKPDCCGNQFRVLAEQLNNGALQTPSQEVADEQLLEDFLGDNAYKLQNMSEAEKAELLLKAKTRDLANHYGKHRHAYERRKSPPGFWDTDFPTTQEHMVTKAQEKQYERDIVAKRYEEAMRPGGAYMFRDE